MNSKASVPLYAIVLLAAFLWGGEYIRRDLWGSDEARYTYVAREMQRDGHVMVPYRNGVAYTHKPPLAFWLMQAAAHMTGGTVSQVSARLPSFLGAILALWATARLAQMWSGPAAAWRALVLLATSWLFWRQSGTARMDPLLCGLELASLYLLFKSENAPSAFRTLGAYVCMGLAILTKGPVGLIVPLGIYLGVRVVSDGAAVLKRMHLLPWGLLVSLAFPAVWLGLAWREGAPPEFFRELLLGQNVGRATGAFGGHQNPFYYYLPCLVTDFLPWSLLLPFAFVTAWRNENLHPLAKRIAAWTGLVVLFFSLVGGKRHNYILSVYPAFSILLACTWPLWAAEKHRGLRVTTYVFATLFVLSAVAAVVAALLPQVPGLPWVWLPSALALLVGGGVLLREARSSGLTRTFFVTAATTLLLAEAAAGSLIWPVFNERKAPRRLAMVMSEHISADHSIFFYRMDGEAISLYSHRAGRRFDDVEEMLEAMRRQGHGIVAMSEKRWREVEDKLQPLPGEPQVATAGTREIVWLEFNMPPGGASEQPARP